jgi:hypothetical protein
VVSVWISKAMDRNWSAETLHFDGGRGRECEVALPGSQLVPTHSNSSRSLVVHTGRRRLNIRLKPSRLCSIELGNGLYRRVGPKLVKSRNMQSIGRLLKPKYGTGNGNGNDSGSGGGGGGGRTLER